jgi:hypothetical protein
VSAEVEDAVQPMHFDPVTGQIVPNARSGPLSAVKKCVEIRRSGDFEPKFQWRNRKTVGRKRTEVMTVSAPGFVIYDLEIFVYLKKGKKPEAPKAGHTRIVAGAGHGLMIENWRFPTEPVAARRARSQIQRRSCRCPASRSAHRA